MPIPCYLALTAAEFANATPLPEKIAWMACHFSCYSTGLSNLPEYLPEGSMLILNDRMPPDRHDPKQITQQLLALVEDLKPDALLLDFQRSGITLNQTLAQALCEALPCPVGVTAEYAKDSGCAVFLEPPPLHIPLADHIAPWADRRIWLELAPQTHSYTVTETGCTISEAENDMLPEPVFVEETLCCRYHTELLEDAAVFTLQRTIEDLYALVKEGCGITRAVGLYQQLGKSKP